MKALGEGGAKGVARVLQRHQPNAQHAHAEEDEAPLRLGRLQLLGQAAVDGACNPRRRPADRAVQWARQDFRRIQIAVDRPAYAIVHVALPKAAHGPRDEAKHQEAGGLQQPE